MTDSKKLLGTTLGTCTLERQVGQGGMGAVYLARQQRPRRSVAVKVLLPGALLDAKSQADFLTRFRREADAIAALDHINIMPIYEYGEQDQLAYLVMPYIAGGTLRQILNERGSLPLHEALPIIEQIAEALDYAHERGIIHRDIKPGNILFHADGRLLLADFGLAKVLSETTQVMAIVNLEEFSLTTDQPIKRQETSLSEGALIGTPEYLSPEQAMGEPVDGRSDIYSLGVVLFQMLAGKVPFIGDTPLATVIMHTKAEPPSISSLVATLPPKVETVILRALAKQPARRYATAGDFARALRAVAELPEQERKSGLALSKSPTAQSLFSHDTVPDLAQVTVTGETTALEHLTAPEIVTPATTTIPHQMAPADLTRRKRPLLLTICLFLIVLIIGGGAFTYLKLKTPITHHPVSAHTVPTPTPTASVSHSTPTVVPPPLIKAGTRHYASARLGSNCADANAQGSWSEDLNTQINCGANATELTNTLPGDQHILAGLFLNSIDGLGIPDDYILQVEAQPASSSQGTFGVLFRNQVDQSVQRHNGAYAFLISPDGTWDTRVYNDITGAPTDIASGPITVPLNGPLTIDIRVQGATFIFYLNGKEQGTATSANFPTGTVGVAVNTGTNVFFKNIALYELP